MSLHKITIDKVVIVSFCMSGTIVIILGFDDILINDKYFSIYEGNRKGRIGISTVSST